MKRSEVLFDVIRGRRSVRKFRPEVPDKATLLKLLEAASWAPAAGGRQEWEFTVISSPEVKARMSRAVRARWDELCAKPAMESFSEEIRRYARNFHWFSEAPVVVVVSTKNPESFLLHICGEAASEISGGRTSAAMAAQNLMLAAHALGLGSCCLTGPLAAEEELKKILGLGTRRGIVCLIALGYPEAPSAAAPARKSVSEIARFVE
ncbi:MAG: nitroreductase family protein [Candidatus Sumerlaeota bacterium]|nr:nitroreductase family protein [Candidatus Sumerlaeota bacterium]